MKKILCNHEAVTTKCTKGKLRRSQSGNNEEKTKKSETILSILILLIAFASIIHAEPYKVGTQLPDFSLKDQHGKTYKLDPAVRLILFVGKDRRGGEIVAKALENTGEGYLAKHNTIYVIDTSGIPRLVNKLFARPKLRKRPYKILLDPEPSVTKDFPSEKDKVTLLYINNRTIEAIEFLGTPEDVKKAIEKMKQETGLNSQQSMKQGSGNRG